MHSDKMLLLEQHNKKPIKNQPLDENAIDNYYEKSIMSVTIKLEVKKGQHRRTVLHSAEDCHGDGRYVH